MRSRKIALLSLFFFVLSAFFISTSLADLELSKSGTRLVGATGLSWDSFLTDRDYVLGETLAMRINWTVYHGQATFHRLFLSYMYPQVESDPVSGELLGVTVIDNGQDGTGQIEVLFKFTDLYAISDELEAGGARFALYLNIDRDGDGQPDGVSRFAVNLTVHYDKSGEPKNNPPVANADGDQTVYVGDMVALDGSGSTDVDGDQLAFSWSFVSVPYGSQAALSDPSAVNPIFEVDLRGAYVVQLVVSDGRDDSDPDTVTISTFNSPPVAVAGDDQTVYVGDTVTLDGGGSFDADGDPLGYQWSLTAAPDGSAAELSDPSSFNPSFVVDLPGTYVIQLVVNDDMEDSAPDTVTVTTLNSRPAADAGEDQEVTAGEDVTLDGSGSFDVDNDPLTYSWSFTALPMGSAAALSDPASMNPSFTTDLAGVYVAQLIVNDGSLDSVPDTVVVTATEAPNYPPAAFDDFYNVDEDATLVVAPGVLENDIDGENDPLTAILVDDVDNGSLVFSPDGSFTYEPDLNFNGTDAFTYKANDGQYDSNVATVTIAVDAVNDAPAADAGSDDVVFTGDTVILDGSGSSDIDNDPLTYSWAFTSVPAGSSAALSGAGTITASFVPDLAGDYVVRLIVNDGLADSLPDSVTVTANQRMVSVPDVVGLAQGDAEAGITAAGLAVGTVGTANSDTVPAGDVISQDPAGGTMAAEGSAVDLVVSLGPAGEELPPDPADVAPDMDRTVATGMLNATEFLYTGDNPIQTGVAEGTIEPIRVAVLRGKVMTREGDPLSGVDITVLNHPEYGQTRSRADGMFDIAVNGGGHLTVDYKKEGYLPVQRKVDAPWQDYAWLPDVVMISLDTQVTTIDLTSSEPIQVAAGSVVTDDDGTRQAVLMIPQGTTAEITLPDGTPQPISTLSLRATEYTVGESGPEAMPAELPPTVGYTYAVELSADEALADGIKVNGKDVVFNQPVAFYVDNFLNFEVGITVPVGYYDNDRGAWIPYENGRVIGIVGITGLLADVDIDGDGSADTGTALSDLGITDAEREQLASLYETGDSLWRAQLGHLSSWDCNWPYGPPPDAEDPPGPDDDNDGDDEWDNPCEDTSSSVIECQNQTLGESVPVTGTPFSLNYRSSRVPGRIDHNTIKITLSKASVPASLRGIELKVSVAGQKFEQSFPPYANQTYTLTWDGMDVYGRKLQGFQPANISIGYVYGAVYYANWPSEILAFGVPGDTVTSNAARGEVTVWQKWTDPIGAWDAREQDLGGWSINVHHVYDPNGKVLYLGDGRKRTAEWAGRVIDTVAGGGNNWGDGVPATEAKLYAAKDIDLGPDGSLYIVDGDDCVRKVGPDGIISSFVGTSYSGSNEGFSGDGGPATEAQLYNPIGVAAGPNGNVFIADTANQRIRRVDPEGIISTFAGNGSSGFSGDGGQATEAMLNSPSYVAVSPDGSLYISDRVNSRIRYVGPGGIISTVAGNGVRGFSGDGGPATEAQLNYPMGIAVGPDGSIYIADQYNHRIRRVSPDGIISTVAGNGIRGYFGDGGQATEAQLFTPSNVAADPDGNLLIVDYGNYVIRRVGPDGVINTFAGNGLFCSIPPYICGDGGLAVNAPINAIAGVVYGPDGNIYVSHTPGIVRVLKFFLPGFTGADTAFASEDSRELYLFDYSGRHFRTLHTLTGAVLYEFTYNAEGRLVEIIDGNGNITSIERDTNGSPLAIVAPGGQITSLLLNTDDYLESITNPAGEQVTIMYGNGGLLSTFTDPRGSTTQFTYNDVGRLTRAEDAAGGFKELSRTDEDNGYTVTRTTALGGITTYQIEFLPTGTVRSTKSYPNGTWNEVIFGTDDGSTTVSYSDGTVVSTQHGPDPRFGMLSPVLESYTVEMSGGLINTMTQSRTVELADPDDVLSLLTLQDTITVNGRTFTNEYDRAERRITQTTPEGYQAVSLMDELGRITSIDPAEGVDPVTVSFDTQGRVAQASRASQSWIYGYDSLNRIISRIDAAGNEMNYYYDDADRVVQLELPGGEVEGYGYDENGNLTQVIMPSNAVHQLGYTVFNYPASYTPPGNADYTRSFNLDRMLINRMLPSGRTLENYFDASWRLTSVDYPEATLEFVYEDSCCNQPISRTHTPADGGTPQVISYTYDGNLITGALWSGMANGEYQYSYDNNFFLTGIRLDSSPDTIQTSITWNDDGMPTGYGPFTLTRGGPGGVLSQVDDSALTMAIGYDSLTRVQNRSQTVNNIPVYSLILTRDNTGLIVQKVETVEGTSHTFDYIYNPDGRLIEVEKDGAMVERYTYDENGNRLSTLTATAVYDTQDRITSHGGVAYTIDGDGYLVQRGTDSFLYSTRGELLSATVASGTVTYAYDTFGRMVGRTDATGTTQYLYGSLGNFMLVTAARSSDGILTVFYYDEEGYLFAMERGGSTYYVATDQVGTPRVVTDSTGTVIKTVEYDSFGIRLTDSNPGFDLPIGFAGGLEDLATGLVRFGYRDYDQVSGRWTARDPALYGGGQLNLYAYLGNDPVGLRDPFGLACVSGSIYQRIGAGGTLCCNLDIYAPLCSLCVEYGIGKGVSLDIGSGSPRDNSNPGADAIAKLGIECGIGGLVGICTYNAPCGLRCDAGVSLGPFQVTVRSGFEYHAAWRARFACSMGGKLAAEICRHLW